MFRVLKDRFGFSLLEVLIAVSILTILVSSTSGMITRILLDGNLVRANLDISDLKNDICSALKKTSNCNIVEHYDFKLSNPVDPRIDLYNGIKLKEKEKYNRHLEIVKLNYDTPNKTFEVFLKTHKVSFAKNDCNKASAEKYISTRLDSDKKCIYLKYKINDCDNNNVVCGDLTCNPYGG